MIQLFQTRSRTMVDSKDVISVKIEKINDTQIRCTLTSEDLADRQLKLSELAYGSEKAKDLFRDMMLQAQDQFGFEADNVPLMIEAIPITPDSIVLIITKVEDPEELDTRFSKFAAGTDETAPSQTEGPSVTGADDILDLFQKLCEGRLKKPVASSEKNKTEDSSDRKTKIQPDTAETHSDTEVAENDIAQTRPDLTRIFTFSSLDTVIRAALALSGWYTGTNTLYKDRETTYVLILHQSGMNPEDFNRVCNMLSEYGTGKACTAATEAYFKEHGEILIADQALQQLLLLNV